MLSTLYTQPHRTYHNLNHINECLTELENTPSLLTYGQRMIVEKAIWYHDAVYNPYSRMNEVYSAMLVQEDPRMINVPVKNIIYRTAYHTITQTVTDPETKEEMPLDIATQVMLDIDLSGFGKNTPECLKNGENVRREYYKTTDYQFAEGRLKFLRAIMQRESLYYTDFFKEKYHVMSQRNLKIEEEMAIETIDDQSGM